MDTAATITVSVLGLAFIVTIILGVVVLLQNPRKWLNRFFFLFTLSAGLWVLTNLLYANTDDQSLQFTYALMSYGAAGYLALFFILYCVELVGVKVSPAVRSVFTAVGLVVASASMVPGIVATGVTADAKIITNDFALMVYGIYLIAYMSGGIAVLLRGRARMEGSEKDRVTIVLLGLVCAAVLGISLNLILPMMGNYDFVAIGPISSLILTGSSTYAIIRHRLFDIKLAAVRTVAYVGVLLTLAAVYYLLAYLLSTVLFSHRLKVSGDMMTLNIVLALILAFLFQPIKRFFDRVTDRMFYKDNYRTEDFIGTLSNLLTSTVELRGLLERASLQIADTLKAEQAFFFLTYSNGAAHHLSAGTKNHDRLPMYDARQLDDYVEKQADKIFLTEFIEDEPIRRMLISHRVALVMPLRNGERIMGYLMLGDHRSGNYTKRDLAVLTTVASELVIAIQNALSLHEVRELNATLQQRIDVATKELRTSNAQLKHLDEVKDEFMSMASHQLRTPLTSVKGYLSMVLDGDAGEISPQQQKLLAEAFSSSERMVRLIADFLNVSRLQTGRFVIDKTDIELKKVVEQEVRNLRVMAAARGLKLELSVPKNEVYLHADTTKLREVAMNFIDNAIYYSKPQGTIKVELVQHADAVEFMVHDTGIGVPKDEQARLFHKFFRATNAREQRPDGTGVGLYLAKKVITAHGGSIIFHSTAGRGSTFGFRLPLAKTTK